MRAYFGDDEPTHLPDPPNEAACFLAVLTESAEPRASSPVLGFVPNLPPEPEPPSPQSAAWHDEEAFL